jgi:PIN domain nuclease of toxin-antitoxin system
VKILLDTHIWIWSFLEPRRLARRVAQAMEDSAVEKWLSPISIWEFMVLVGKGRVELTIEPHEWIVRALSEFPVTEAPLTSEVALATPAVDLPHRDPADSFLAATAKVFDLTLVTADSRLLAAKGISVLANR